MSFDTIEPREVSKKISDKVLNKSLSYIEPSATYVLFKYSGLFILSILFSLIVCPQNGVGLIRTNFPIYHSIFHNNMLICGLYCGFMFFATTHLVSFYILNHFERLIIFKKRGYLPNVCMSLFFAFSMTPFFSVVSFSVLYFIGWFGMTMSAVWCHKKLFLYKIDSLSA